MEEDNKEELNAEIHAETEETADGPVETVTEAPIEEVREEPIGEAEKEPQAGSEDKPEAAEKAGKEERFSEKESPDYRQVIERARKKRNTPTIDTNAVIAAAAIFIVVVAAVIIGVNVSGRNRAEAEEAAMIAQAEAELLAEEEATAAEEEARRKAEEEEAIAESIAAEEADLAARQAVVDSYDNLGFVKVSGYLNIRSEPQSWANVIGKLMGDSACEILDSLDGWYLINSGGITGYVSSQYVLTGDAAREDALEHVAERAVIDTDNLNIRSEPSTDGDIMGQALINERYEILGESDGWYQIASGYISSDYAHTDLCLNEARTLDLKAMVLNYYDHPGVSNVSSYLNIRDGASESANIIAKLPSYAGCEILDDSTDGWYKIRSGGITGYVKSDYILTGDTAREAAMDHAELVAVVETDTLNARTAPSTDSNIWTQISNNEKYPVISQQDGWVEIEFDDTDTDGTNVTAYVSSEFVDVRYGLSEAIKFSPAEENASLRSQVVNYAMQFLGNRYVWGGTSLTNGCDCSGFTMQVLAHFGYKLPHYSGDQAKCGTRITSASMRPGDLIVYGNTSGTINHVAMYIGNGQIIHAASTKSGIKISSWNYRTPLRIVDIIGD